MWVRKIKSTLRKSRCFGDLEDSVDSKSDLTERDLILYPNKSLIFVRDEGEVYEVVHKYVEVWEDDHDQ